MTTIDTIERTKAIKKDMQKIVKKFRDTLPDCIGCMGDHYRPLNPRAMLTQQQMRNGTATINFGWNNEYSNNNLDEFAASEAFKTFCERHGIQVGGKEINQDNCVQIRLYI